MTRKRVTKPEVTAEQRFRFALNKKKAEAAAALATKPLGKNGGPVVLDLSPDDKVIELDANNRHLIALEVVRLLHNRDASDVIGNQRDRDGLDDLLDVAVRCLTAMFLFGPVIQRRNSRKKPSKRVLSGRSN